MSNDNHGGSVTVPRSTLEQLYTELSKADAPQDMLIAGTLIVLERLLNIENEPIELEPTPELLWASDVDRYKGFGI